MKSLNRHLRRITWLLILYSLVIPTFALSDDAKSGKKKLTDDQKIIHVLNRLGFGARPGDVERVRAMGIEKYIDQQLNALSISDAAAEARVKDLEIFNMSTAEVFAKYPNPGALLRQLEGGRQGQAAQQAANDKPEDPEKAAADQRERRQKLEALYREYDLRPAGQLVPQITANRVLRAVYSERQLQEVMVDF